MSICRRSAQWGLHTRQWHLINCERQPLEIVTKIAIAALEGRKKQIYTAQKDFGDHVVLYNTRRISLEGNMWEEHCYHFKSDWSQKKLKRHLKQRNNQDRVANLKRNFFLTAEEAHAYDPTYVVRESVYGNMRVFKYMENNDEVRDVAFGRLNCFADDDVPAKMIENISNVVQLDAVPKKLSDYSQQEVESFSRHFPELAGQRDYSVLGDQEHYPYEKSLLERAGPEGSLQELELKRSLNLEEFYVKESEPKPRDTKRWFKSTKRFV